MTLLPIIITIGIILFFALIVSAMIRSVIKDALRKAQHAAALGFTPHPEDAELLQQILTVYPGKKPAAAYRLKHVFRKSFPEGSLFLFDLVDTSGEGDSWLENQTVAVISSGLDLPAFTLFPLSGMEGRAANLANRFMRMAVTKIGSPVDSPDCPEFQNRYLLAAPDPEAVRRYFQLRFLQRLAQTRWMNIHAAGPIFTFSIFNPALKNADPQSLAQRVNQALGVLAIFQQEAPRDVASTHFHRADEHPLS